MCSKPECFANETYDIIIKPAQQNSTSGLVDKNHFQSSTTNNQASDTEEAAARQHSIRVTPQPYSQGANNRHLHGLQSLSTLGGVTGHTQSGYGSSRRIFEEAPSQRLPESAHKHSQQRQQSSNRDTNVGQMHHILQQPNHGLSPSSMGYGLSPQFQ